MSDIAKDADIMFAYTGQSPQKNHFRLKCDIYRNIFFTSDTRFQLFRIIMVGLVRNNLSVAASCEIAIDARHRAAFPASMSEAV